MTEMSPHSLTANEEHFRLLVEAVEDYSIYMLDAQGRVATWNTGAERNKGYTSAEIIGKHYSRFFLPKDAAAGMPQHGLEEAARHGHYAAEGWRVRKDGTLFWASVAINPIRGKDGTLLGFAKVTRDLTERRESEERFRHLVDAVEDYAIYMLDPKGYITTWNKGAERNKGYNATEIIGKHFSCFFLPKNVEEGAPQRALDEAERTGHFAAEGWRVRKDGTTFWASVILNPIRDDGKLLGFAKVTRDLTGKASEEALRVSQQALQAERDRLKVLVQCIGDCVVSVGDTGCVDLMNPAAESMTNVALNQARGQPVEAILNLVDAQSGEPLKNPVRVCLASKSAAQMQQGAAILLPSGTKRDVQISANPIRSLDGDVTGAVLTFHDVTQMRAVQRELEFSATHDALTKLPNRRKFEEGLTNALVQAQATGVGSAICAMDLDWFKNVNDVAGHLAGDSLLCIVSDLITRNVCRQDLVARLGGDEFAIIFNSCTTDVACARLENIRDDIARLRFCWGDHVFRISASIGVTSITAESDVTNAVREADIACYAAKNSGRNLVNRYSSASDRDRRQAHRTCSPISPAQEV